MGIKNYVRQVRPVQESYVNHLDKIQNLYSLYEGSSLNRKELIKPAGKGPNTGVPRIEIFANKISKGEEHMLDDGTTIVIKQITMDGKTYASKDMKSMVTDFEDATKISITDPATAWGDIAKTPEYGGEGGGTKISTSTQELMTATIVLLGKKYNSKKITVEDAAEIIKAAEGKWDAVEGSKGKEKLLKQFANNWYDLATAVSSANAILDMVPNPTKVYWTGQSWHDDIKIFNPDIVGVKDYNSSDIVVSDGKKFWGLSLKKKESRDSTDPTLINKPISGSKSFLKSLISDEGMSQAELDSIENKKNEFFTNIIASYLIAPENKRTTYKNLKTMRSAVAVVKKLDDKKRKEEIGRIPNKFVNTQLTTEANLFWKEVDKVLKSHAEEFMVSFIKLVFRYELKDHLEDLIAQGKTFEFYLLTGIGKRVGDEIGIEPADVKDLPSTVQALSRIFRNPSALNLGDTPGRKLPWEVDLNAVGTKKPPAKLFYTIFYGKAPLLNLEIRYKGSKTVEPQFQCTATPVFKTLMKVKK